MRVNIIHLRLFFIASLVALVILLLSCYWFTRLRLVKYFLLKVYLLDLWEVLLALRLVLVHQEDSYWLRLPWVGTLIGIVVLGVRPISAGLVASPAGIRRAWWPSSCRWPGTCRWTLSWWRWSWHPLPGCMWRESSWVALGRETCPVD